LSISEKSDLDRLITELYRRKKIGKAHSGLKKPNESIAKTGVLRERAKVWRVYAGKLYVSNREIGAVMGVTKELRKRDLLKMGVKFVTLSNVPIDYEEAVAIARARGIIA
jgi:hypothetical protein